MIKSKLPTTSTSIFSIMSAMAAENNAINLAQGFPNFSSDEKLIQLVSKAMQDGYNQYAPMAGDLDLRVALSHKIEHHYRRTYNPTSDITITAGATQAIFTAIAAIISAGDEVIIFTPAYDCYEPTIQLFGGKTIPIQLKSPSYKPDWDEVAAKISSKTKLMIINSPHNPTGMLFNDDDMLQVEALSIKHNLLVISDEVYEHIIFDGNTHHSASKYEGLSERTFVVSSFGKTFHNTGWKLGYIVAPQPLMKEFQKVHQFNVFCVNHPIQKALATYIQDPENYQKLPGFYQQKRDYFLKQLSGSKFKIIPSKGTYFQLLDYSNFSLESDLSFSERLTKEFKIATIPTSVFNSNREDFKQLRVCFAKTEETLAAAGEILRQI